MAAGPKIIDRTTGTVQTTDAATTTTVATRTMTSDTTGSYVARLTGRDAAGNCASAEQSGGCKDVASTTTVVGTPVNLVSFAAGSDAALATCQISVDGSGNTLRLRVNGVVATTIDWFGTLEVSTS